MKRHAVLVLLLFAVGCTNRAATAPVPGTINTFDAYAARSVGDAQAALVGAKAWELCSDGQFPATVAFDGKAYPCDAGAGPFPSAGRGPLFRAEQTYNLALDAAKAYHAGAGADTTALAQALTQLSLDIGGMLTSIGKGK